MKFIFISSNKDIILLVSFNEDFILIRYNKYLQNLYFSIFFVIFVYVNEIRHVINAIKFGVVAGGLNSLHQILSN